MPATTITVNRLNMGQAVLDPNQIRGEGGPSAPRMFLPLRLEMSLPPNNPLDALQGVALRAELWVSNLLLSIAPYEPLSLMLHAGCTGGFATLCALHFPLDLARVDILERSRLGGEMRLRLSLNLFLNQLRQISDPKPGYQGYHGERCWNFVRSENVPLQIDFVVPRDTWISNVLPGLGYGQIHLLEFPAAPLESCQALDVSFKALQQAAEQHKLEKGVKKGVRL